MARLDPNKIKRRMEQSLTKDKVLKRKLEKQKQKEIYEEKWYKDEMEQRAKDLEDVAPVENDEDVVKNRGILPIFFDCFDIHTLFNPIKLIKDKDDKRQRIKLEEYKANERLFEPGLINLDNEFALQDELVDFYSKIFNDDENYQELMKKRKEVSDKLKQARKERIDREEAKKKFNLDLSDIKDEDSERELAKLIEEYEDMGITEEDLLLITDDEIPTVKNTEMWEKLGKFRTNFFSKASKYFQRFIPIYDKYTCTCCGKAKGLEEYYIYYNLVNLSRADYYGNVRLSICKECSHKLFNYFYLEESGKCVEVALKKWCATLNIYYNDKLAIQALRNFNVNEHENHFIKEYLDLVYLNEDNIEKTFLDSPFLFEAFDKVNKEDDDDSIDEALKESEPFEWKKEDIKNKKQVVRMIGYDPFDFQTDENKVMLYSDLLNMLEAGMENDMVKVQAAIQIVLSYFRIRELNAQEYQMRKDNASLADLRSLSELKAKELTSISKFSQDNGFSERFATAKARGENTFTGIMKKMLDDKFEDAIANKFDIETSVTIQQAADASISAMFKQLNMSTAEYGVLLGKQLKEIEDLRKENALLTEQIRKVKVENKREELINQAKEAGVYEADEVEDEDD